ncbi:MAG: hypothetical protein CML68_10605 [Rhodobacteraceae bacterium]|nr:hypothetical protein [Paracoccaceae bacterium]
MAGDDTPQKAQREIRRLLAHIAALEAERDRLKERDRNYQAVFDRVTDKLASDAPRPDTQHGFGGLSFVVVYHDIPRQIERTLTSLSPAYQGMDPAEIEVILVDNGSPSPLPEGLQARHPHVTQVMHVADEPSPVTALNQGIQAARFDMLALMIDGAHMLSPGVAGNARRLWGLYDNPVISVPQYMLGRESQGLTRQSDAFDAETRALEELGWPGDGYRLFDHAVYPGEDYHRTYVEAIESNCLVTTRAVLDRCGGFDPRYDEPGGGFANLELFSRLIHDPDNSYIVLPGEGSFHQDHRGTTTQRAPEERTRLVSGYRKRHAEVTGSTQILNARSPILFGKTRRLTQRVPTISREFGRVSHRIQRQLADIYVARVRGGLIGQPRPALTLDALPDERLVRPPLAPAGLLPEAAARNGVAPEALGYLTCLKQVHEIVAPRLYFEIGIDTGTSLALAKCPSVGVDPDFRLSNAPRNATRLFRQTSDAFFADGDRCAEVLGQGIDLAFIDGMHLSDYVLRDFIRTEKWMRKGGVILFDDVLPEQMQMLERERRFNAWTGDVFKIVPVLRRWRPDLRVTVFETFIGPYRKGLAMVTGADPDNRVLDDHLPEIEAALKDGAFDVGSIAALDRLMRPAPLSSLPRAARGAAVTDLGAAQPSEYPDRPGDAVPEAPRLSVVVVAHDMARELPRTLQSLVPPVQRGLPLHDYELIVVDNGSTAPADPETCLSIAPNARLITLPPGNPSPCHALNIGIAAARAERIAVFIDGARMASPGLLARGLAALGDDRRNVVGSFGLHLGAKVQSEAVAEGYDTTAEDALLASTDWQADGYRLFDMSVMGKSSGKGWDVLPSESNAVFLHGDFWQALNGYDEGFVSPGGGLANLDLWKRACEFPGARIRMIQGEGTFHQVHGGATTGSAVSRRPAFDAEYAALRAEPYRRPDRPADFLPDTRPSQNAASDG